MKKIEIHIIILKNLAIFRIRIEPREEINNNCGWYFYNPLNVRFLYLLE